MIDRINALSFPKNQNRPHQRRVQRWLGIKAYAPGQYSNSIF